MDNELESDQIDNTNELIKLAAELQVTKNSLSELKKSVPKLVIRKKFDFVSYDIEKKLLKIIISDIAHEFNNISVSDYKELLDSLDKNEYHFVRG